MEPVRPHNQIPLPKIQYVDEDDEDDGGSVIGELGLITLNPSVSTMSPVPGSSARSTMVGLFGVWLGFSGVGV